MTTASGFKASHLCLVALVLFVCPASAVEFAGGTGEPNDPYQIATAEQLISIGLTSDLLDKCFVLVADIDLDPNLPGRDVFCRAVIAPAMNRVGDFIPSDGFEGCAFDGDFDGSGYQIRHLTIHGGTGSFIGLFGSIGPNGCVHHLRLEDVDIAGLSSVGGLAGRNRGVIESCHVKGRVFGYRAVGGLAGANLGNDISWRGGVVGNAPGKIVNCSARGEVLGGERSMALGGLVGHNGLLRCCEVPITEGTIMGCYATSHILGGEKADGLGGLVGWHNLGTITDCYAGGNVTAGRESQVIGGLVGYYSGDAVRCYSTGRVSAGEDSQRLGGLAGDSFGAPINSFWDVETSGIKVSDGGVGLTTVQMMDARTYGLNGWAGDPNWVLDGSKDYPRLAWEGKTGQIIPAPVVDWLVGVGTREDPYRIATPEQLAFIGTASTLWDKSFLLVSDLDLTGIEVASIGVLYGIEFTGTFDGNGHVLRHLTWDTKGRPGSSLGLFRAVSSGARISRLGIENAEIRCGEYSGGVGVLAAYNSGSISCCYATGSLSAASAKASLGGLVATNNGAIAHCYATVDVSAGKGSMWQLGGLVGVNEGPVIDCYATGRICSQGTCQEPGALVGHNDSIHGTVSRASNDRVGERANGTADLWMIPAAGGPPVLALFSESYQRHPLEGSGTLEDPYRIASAEDLGAVNHYDLSACYRLTADIDLAGIAWSIAPIWEFDGTFIGGGFAISNLTIDGENYLGLFGMLGDNARVTDLTVAGADIVGKEGGAYMGILTAWNAGSIENCRCTGRIYGGAQSSHVGGLVGENEPSGTIANCLSTAQVSTEGHYVGGLVGLNYGSIAGCRATGKVSGREDVGPLVGENYGSIIDSSATGRESGE
jgi:hypothetical protein